ncbi:hypothetical protein ACHAXA_003748 [Cyclostephanos tholiformis]|uniref:Uncharacterized protein n=1 Tax=Cyclostephanos tholiformis TaxID=382380 RepID=A0ABD3SS79_9STRA
MLSRPSILLIASALSVSSSSSPTTVRASAFIPLVFPRKTTTTTTTTTRNMFGRKVEYAAPCVMGDESIMSPKAHAEPALELRLRHRRSNMQFQSTLRRICRILENDDVLIGNRVVATGGGGEGEVTFYDSNTGKPLFVAPRGRDMDSFLRESESHGWPSFRDEEVIWDNVRCLPNGEAVSVDGTHLGHNLPDGRGNRYCINLVSVAGRPVG